jgi:hypothetical protein
MTWFPITHLGDVRLPNRHRVHFALARDDSRGMGGRPILALHLTGPNGSILGVGPKPWPLLRRGSRVQVALPFVTWRVQHHLPRVIGRPIARAQSFAYRRLYDALRERSNRLCREAQAAQFRGLA